jgi:hypothetical protein
VLTALSFKEPDRVPLFYRDVPEVEQRLLRDLGLKDREDLLRFFDIDFRWVGPEYCGPPLGDETRGCRRDIWGVEYQYTRFSESAGYWEAVTQPLSDAENPDDLNEYPWPSITWFDFSTLSEQVDQSGEYALMTAPGVASPGILHITQFLVGMEKNLMNLVLDPTFFRALVERILDFLKPFVDRMLEAGGDRIDFFRVGDDYGTQNGLMLSPKHWRELVQPSIQQLNEVVRRHRGHLYLHSCGAVRDLIPGFIETGIEVLDPVQVKAAGMEPGQLKREFGEQICFCGGLDEQELLPRGTADEVRSGVNRLLDVMAGGGGFILGPTHNFQDDIPTENIVAMYEAAREWKY